MAENYLDLVAGPYRVALRASCVIAVDQNIEFENDGTNTINGSDVRVSTIRVRGDPVRLIHLGDPFGSTISGDPRWTQAPFAVVVECSDGERVALGADHVGHLREAESDRSVLPRFGMQRPELFEGAVREGDLLLLVLNPDYLSKLVAVAQNQHRGWVPSI